MRKYLGYGKAAKKALKILKDTESTEQLIKDVEQKSEGLQEKFGDLWDDFKALTRMLKAWVLREYDAPWKLVTTVGAVFVYFIMPLDAIPDILLGFGYIDDLAIFAWAVKRMRTQIDNFKMWESSKASGAITSNAITIDNETQEKLS